MDVCTVAIPKNEVDLREVNQLMLRQRVTVVGQLAALVVTKHAGNWCVDDEIKAPQARDSAFVRFKLCWECTDQMLLFV